MSRAVQTRRLKDHIASLEEEFFTGFPPSAEGKDPVASVRNAVKERATPFGQVYRFPERERRDVLDFAARVARREFKIGDDCVVRVLGIDLAESSADDSLIRADIAV